MAFDFGEKRIGVAVGDLGMGIAHPLATIEAADNPTRFSRIEALLAEWKPAQLVVGEPRHADGGAHEVARLAQRFAQRLRGRYGLPVAMVDETLTSAEAAAQLQAQGASGASGTRGGKAALDAAAACVILQTWLESR